EAAQQHFRAVAERVATPAARAEAQHNVYQAALARRDWPAALAALQLAAGSDPDRWAPFPLGKYEPQRILGAGGFGVVFLCKHRHLGGAVLVKALVASGNRGEPKEAFSEASLLEELDHPALVRVRDGDFAGPVSDRPYVVMDYFDAGDLHKH